MNAEMEKFINEQILALSIVAAFQHAKIYRDDITVTDEEKLAFRCKLQEHLETISLDYKNKPVTEEQHIDNLKKLKENMTTEFKDILFGNRFRVGIAQKALNLYLKYLWCLGKITEPPHCPFDSIIISEIHRNDKYTEMDSIDEYKSLVESAKQAANKESLSLANWELNKWNKWQRQTIYGLPD